MSRALWLWAPPALLAALLFYVSSRPVPGALAPPAGLDKVVHFAVYAVLGAFCARAFEGAGVRAAVLWGAALASAWGVLDEVHQSFVPARSAEALDALADAAGSLAGAAAWSWGARRLREGRRTR